MELNRNLNTSQERSLKPDHQSKAGSPPPKKQRCSPCKYCLLMRNSPECLNRQRDDIISIASAAPGWRIMDVLEDGDIVISDVVCFAVHCHCSQIGRSICPVIADGNSLIVRDLDSEQVQSQTSRLLSPNENDV